MFEGPPIHEHLPASYSLLWAKAHYCADCPTVPLLCDQKGVPLFTTINASSNWHWAQNSCGNGETGMLIRRGFRSILYKTRIYGVVNLVWSTLVLTLKSEFTLFMLSENFEFHVDPRSDWPPCILSSLAAECDMCYRELHRERLQLTNRKEEREGHRWSS